MAHAIIDAAVESLHAGRADVAADTLRDYVKRRPSDPLARFWLATALQSMQRLEEALVHAHKAAALAPADPRAGFFLGMLAASLGRHDEAVQAFQACVQLCPRSLDAGAMLLRSLLAMGRHEEAWAAQERMLREHSGTPEVIALCATGRTQAGDVAGAIRLLRAGIEAHGDNATLLELLCYTLNFSDAADARDHAALHRRLGAAVAGAAPTAPRRIDNTRDPDRPLRVAFLSGDLREHACAYFLEAPLRALDPARAELFIYSTTPAADSWTDRFRGLGQWRACESLDAPGLARVAANDRIDILVECNGWTRGNRLAMLTPRIAPIQITYLGYPNTTGLPAIDYRIVDAHTDPPAPPRDPAECPTEQLLRLPRCFICYSPPPAAPPITPRAQGPLTLGSFNRLEKLSDSTIAAWGAAARALPDCRILLRPGGLTPREQKDLSARLVAAGAGRVHFSPFVAMADRLHAYAQIDIALDASPYNGTTTTCEALWMGVPVVTLSGPEHRSRVGRSILAALDLADLAASTREEFAAIVAGLAADAPRLASLRAGLRDRMRQSELCDGPGMARALESAFRAVWRRWCAGESPADSGAAT